MPRSDPYRENVVWMFEDRAMPCFTGRSGLLRTTPLSGVVALREPAAIARKPR